MFRMRKIIVFACLSVSAQLFAMSPCRDGHEVLVRVNDRNFVPSLKSPGISASMVKDSSGRIDGVEVLFSRGERTVLKLNKSIHLRKSDWTGYASLNLDVENTSSTVINIGVSIVSKEDSWEDGNRAGFTARMAPGRAQWSIPLPQLRYTNGWSWPRQAGFERIGGWGRADSAQIATLELSVDNPARDVGVIIRAISLEGRIPSEKWVDRYGQNTCGDWPGKVSSDVDIVAADMREGMDLVSATSLSFGGRDEYGAWTAGPRRKEGRFFRVEKYGGRWWFVAPSGRPWLAVGMDCVIPGIFARMDSTIKKAYSWLPPEMGEFASAWKPGERDAADMTWPSFYRVNIIRKWGPESFLSKWRERAIARTRAWGFTCFGNWSDESLFKSGIPYFSVGPDIWTVKVPFVTSDIADAFHPDFEAEAGKAAEGLKRFRGDPWLVGHFIGNEMNWNEFPKKMLEAPVDLPSKAAFMQRMRKRYRSIAAMNSAWGISASAFEDVRWPGRRKANEAAKRDMGDFLMVFADRFIGGWARAIRKSDPDHLLLGTRFHAGNRPDEVVRATAKYMDVVTFNCYGYSIDRAEFDRLQAMTHRPFMIGEYGFNSMDMGQLSVAVPVRDRAERGAGYRYYTEQVAAIPYFVGCQYFQYLDEPITGRFDRETSYNGFVSVSDMPYSDLVEAARETNGRIYAIHNQSITPVLVQPEQ